MVLQIAICDDEFQVCSEIESIILKFQKESGLEIKMETFYSGESLCEFIQHEHFFDLIFLDIEMKDWNGMKVGGYIRRRLEDYTTKLVYISSKEIYDRLLFEVQPFHFIPKPVKPELIVRDICLVLKIIQRTNMGFSYRVGSECYKKPIQEILYFESISRQIKMITKQEKIIFYGTMEEVVEQVPQYQFLQIHRSYLVNYEQVKQFRYKEVIMSNGETLPISQLRRTSIRKMQVLLEREMIKRDDFIV